MAQNRLQNYTPFEGWLKIQRVSMISFILSSKFRDAFLRKYLSDKSWFITWSVTLLGNDNHNLFFDKILHSKFKSKGKEINNSEISSFKNNSQMFDNLQLISRIIITNVFYDIYQWKW